jgi:acetyl-CoA carboxylase biotin carboxyl carrier protein
MRTMTIEEALEIISFFDGSRLEEVSLCMGQARVHVRKTIRETQSASPAPPAGPSPSPEEILPITAPRLGVFQRAAGTGDSPLADLGQEVTPESPAGYIRVLEKTYAVPAGIRGRIVRICAGEGDLVEYGEPLFLVSAKETKAGGRRS